MRGLESEHLGSRPCTAQVEVGMAGGQIAPYWTVSPYWTVIYECQCQRLSDTNKPSFQKNNKLTYSEFKETIEKLLLTRILGGLA